MTSKKIVKRWLKIINKLKVNKIKLLLKKKENLIIYLYQLKKADLEE